MRNRQTINMRILSALVGLTAVAWACDYTAFENPNDFAYRYCAVAVRPSVRSTPCMLRLLMFM